MPDFIDLSDFLSRSSALRNHGRTRAAFDPANPDHLASLKKFLETGSWGAIMFFPEFPFTDVPTYVLTKYASYQLGASRKSNAEQAVEAAAARKSLAEVAARNLELGELVDPVHEDS
jgi:hypothetical protein